MKLQTYFHRGFIDGFNGCPDLKLSHISIYTYGYQQGKDHKTNPLSLIKTTLKRLEIKEKVSGRSRWGMENIPD